MSETLKQQHENQLEDIKQEYLDALTQQWLATKKDLTELQGSIVSGNDELTDLITDTGIVEETLGLIPQYLLDSYISGGFFAGILSPLMLKKFFDDTQLGHIKEFRKEFVSLRKKLGKDSFSQGLQQLQEKHLSDVILTDEKDFYQDSDEVDEHRSIDFSDKDQILLSDVQSEKFNWNKKTGVTWCSWTARLNADNFGIKIPSGNAFDAKNKAIEDTQHFVSTIEQAKGLGYKDFSSVDSRGNFADIFIQSTTHPKYGHRAIAFKNLDDGKRYVLDPYRASMSDKSDRATKQNAGNKKAHTPKLLDDYIKHNTIVKSNFYAADKVVVDVYKEQDIAA